MATLKWLNSVLTGNRTDASQAAAGHGAGELKKKENSGSVDLVNAALVDHAEDLNDLIFGTPFLKRKKLKERVKKKVKKIIAEEFDDPDLIEEVTERITDAAEIDPFYKNLFKEE